MAHYFGDSGTDNFSGTSGRDYMSGGGGNDGLHGAEGDDRLLGGDGDDLISGGRGDDYIDGGRGVDAITFFDQPLASGIAVNLNLRIISNDGYGDQDRIFTVENVFGGRFNDVIIGSNARNLLTGEQGHDFLSGEGRNDLLMGGGGNDTLAGGRHADRLFGGSGADTFLFTDEDLAAADPVDVRKTADRIYDFTSADIIDLRQIDAIAGGADNAFNFIGSDPFGGTAGELRTEIINNRVYVFGDTNGDSVADLSIMFVDFITLSSADFLL